VSFSFFFSVSHIYRHIPCPTVCISHFPHFLVLLTILQVL
jgi:hypothetical protein